MPRKKTQEAEVMTPVIETPQGIGHTLPEGPVIRPKERSFADTHKSGDGEGKNWGDPYKSIVKTPGFEMGENRRFHQRVFMFKDKPAPEVLSALKENGFTYRANEKAWTIQANPDTRRLSEELAEQFAGPSGGKKR